MINLNDISKDAKLAIDSAMDMGALDDLRVKFLGKKGLLTERLKAIGTFPVEERPAVGQAINQIKHELQEAIELRRVVLKNLKISKALNEGKIDVTLPGRGQASGGLHLCTKTMERIQAFFVQKGFSVEEGPEIEDDYHNFEALNIPAWHPARAMHDTFYFPDGSLLRTHTSPVQIRVMRDVSPPIQIIAPGRVYRMDSDLTHTPMFHQVEGLVINKDATMADLKSTLITFLKEFFEIDNLKYRFRPSYFPFTEPSAEMDVAFTKKNNVIKIGEGEQWLEILGCGMVNPRVLENCKIDSSKYQGFAFGMGIERLSMLKYGITDMRGFFDSNFKWLHHYGFNPLDLSSSSGV